MYDPNDFDWLDWEEQYKRIGPVIVRLLQLAALLLIYGIAVEWAFGSMD